jgi:hypothetical protein
MKWRDKPMMRLVELTIFVFFIVKTVKFFFGKRQNKSVLGKILLLISRGIHHRLDRAIKKQSRSYGISKVVPFKRRRKVN